ncbi:MAG TPA: molybdate ABC transporter substrate-binding protein, partial [Candidatus Kryptonia bacterium]|nr:molybdate ABC transporter substrate-binding protein [Candidatus Kryptonia bacterium]
MRPRSYLVIAVFLVSRLGTPSHAEEAKGAAAVNPSATVTVFAAASLTIAFQTMASAFGKAHPGARVQLNFAGSPTLVQQIEQGAPADVFASADEANMRKLAESGAIAGTPQLFAHNVLQIVVSPGNP